MLLHDHKYLRDSSAAIESVSEDQKHFNSGDQRIREGTEDVSVLHYERVTILFMVARNIVLRAESVGSAVKSLIFCR